MRRSNLLALAALDLRALVRDRRTVIFSIVLPLVVMPLFLFASTTLEKRRQASLDVRTFTYAIAADEGDPLYETVASALASARSGEAADAAQFEPKAVASPGESLANGSVDVYIELLEGDQALEAARKAAERAGEEPETAVAGVPAVEIHYRSNSTVSAAAARRLESVLDEARDTRREALLAERNLFVAETPFSETAATDVASSSQSAGARIGGFLTVLVIFLLLMGGATVASDVIAGERERGTLETLLTTAALRSEIVAAKLGVIFAVSLVIIVVELLSILAYAGLRVIDLPGDYQAALTPANILLLLLLYLPVGAVVSAVLLLLSGYARSYKEAQLYFFPVVLLGAAIGAAPLLPGIDLRSAIAVVPVSGLSVAVKEVLVGEFDWPMIALAWFSTVLAAALVARRGARLLSSEDFITGAGADSAEAIGGVARFRRHVPRWFAIMWVAVFAASSYATGLDLRAQVAINLLGIFLGFSLLMLRVYKLDVREALRLRMPHPMAWVAALVGAPSALVVGLGIAELGSYFFPVPEELLRQFGQELFPPSVPLWQMLLFIAVLPGICEEVAFRGMLLYGLKRRFGPVGLCIAVGLIFGLFHFALFRLLGTAFLGVILSAVTLLSGSIFPAMLWHMSNNAIAVLAVKAGYGGEVPLWWSAVAVVPLALSFWLFWKFRRVDQSRSQ